MGTIRAVIFDLGHTLWDYAPREDSYRLRIIRFCQQLQAAVGEAPPPEAVARTAGGVLLRWYDEWDSGKLEQPPSAHFVRETLEGLEIAATDDLVADLTGIMFGGELDVPYVEPDTLATLATLDARGLALGCVTNTITLEEGIVDALDRLGLRRYFRSIVASSLGGYHKPHASLFERAMRELDVAPQETVFVGDRLEADVKGARAVGMHTVLTHQYRQEAVDGAVPQPDAVIKRLSELPPTLERIEAR